MPPADDLQDAWLSESLPADPLPKLGQWFDEAVAQSDPPNPNAFTLCTTEEDGRPSARVVLCKQLDRAEGWLAFYTNLKSPKARALRNRPYAAAVFNFDRFWRQVRIEGPVTPAPAADADAYFASRPLEAQIAAWASAQSEPIDSRATLLTKLDTVAERFRQEGVRSGLPRPDFWGGYRLWIARVELWISRRGRVHDRGRWTRELEPVGDGFAGGAWDAVRLQP